MGGKGSIRAASHAGSWYSDDASSLQKQIEEYLETPNSISQDLQPSECSARAIICPHAGYTYCGSTLGASYRHLATEGVHRVFILGPCHRLSMIGCGLPEVSRMETPFGMLEIDREVVQELISLSKGFQYVSRIDDEEEHSIEMQLPFLAHLFHGKSVKVVPMMVGHVDEELEKDLASILRPYFEDPSTVVVLSSDFCHWGRRFRYTFVENSSVPLWKSIQELDLRGASAIESMDPDVFRDYLAETSNTICGRNPICLYLRTVGLSDQLSSMLTCRFVHYSQSSHCIDSSDSSVSYAAGVFFPL